MPSIRSLFSLIPAETISSEISHSSISTPMPVSIEACNLLINSVDKNSLITILSDPYNKGLVIDFVSSHRAAVTSNFSCLFDPLNYEYVKLNQSQINYLDSLQNLETIRMQKVNEEIEFGSILPDISGLTPGEVGTQLFFQQKNLILSPVRGTLFELCLIDCMFNSNHNFDSYFIDNTQSILRSKNLSELTDLQISFINHYRDRHKLAMASYGF
jgi:hypothetical protein